MFKVGDKVRVVKEIKDGYAGSYEVGDVTEISSVNSRGYYLLGEEDPEESCWVYRDEYLELYEEEEEEDTAPQMVLKINGKFYKSVEATCHSCRVCDLQHPHNNDYCTYGSYGEDLSTLPCKSISALVGEQQVFKEVR